MFVFKGSQKFLPAVSDSCTADLNMCLAISDRAHHADAHVFHVGSYPEGIAAVRHLTKLQDLTMNTYTK